MDTAAESRSTTVTVGADATFTLSFTNHNLTSPIVDISISGATGPFTLAENTCGTSLAPQKTCSITIRYPSTGEETLSTLLAIDYVLNGNAERLEQELTVTSEAATGSVEPVYPTHAAWNTYIKNNNGGTHPYDQPDVACTGAETGGNSACIHGGEKRKLVVSNRSSCSGLTLSELLGAFDWECKVVNDEATFFSQKLAAGKGLKDLVSATDWKENQLTITAEGKVILRTPAAIWWSNPVMPLPDNAATAAVTLADTGTIYTLASSRATLGYNLNADQLALVTLEDATLSYAGAAGSNCKNGTAENADVGNNLRCVVASGSQKFLWLEGNFDGAGASAATQVVYFASTNFSRLHQVVVSHGIGSGLTLESSSSNLVSNLATLENVTLGIEMGSSSNNTFQNIVASHNGTAGLKLSFGHYNTFHQINAFSNGSHGIQLSSAQNNTITNGITANNTGDGIRLDGPSATYSSKNTISFITSTNNGGNGLNLYEDTDVPTNSYNTMVQVLAMNNGAKGINVWAVSTNRFSQIAMGNNATYGIYMDGCGAFNNKFQNNAIFGTGHGNADCTVGGGSGNEINGGGCTYGGATVNVVTGLAMSSSLVGKLNSDDTSNTSDLSGAQLLVNIVDWLRFDNAFRGWGASGAAFPATDNRGPCTSGSCQIWDLSLKQGAGSVLLNRSGNGATANSAFINGAACPSPASGATTVVDSLDSGARTFLANAFEIQNDGIGNDNGLCESGEACIYAPNFGAYQGSGDYTSQSCAFQGGAVTGVTLYAYPTNGA